MDESERRRWGRIGGLTAWSRNSAQAMQAGARRGFRARFVRQVDPDGTLPEVEREARADRAMRAHMLTLAAKSAAARRKGAPDKKIPRASVSPGGIEAEGLGDGRPPIR